MKRFHVHVRVSDLEHSIRFYSTLFGADPAVLKPDYAKWMLEDPRVNFAISARGQGAGIDHLGIQVDSADELGGLAGALKSAGETTFDEKDANCCYAVSDKAWVRDPSDVRWETFFTHGEATAYGEDADASKPESAGAETSCCKVAVQSSCCAA